MNGGGTQSEEEEEEESFERASEEAAPTTHAGLQDIFPWQLDNSWQHLLPD